VSVLVVGISHRSAPVALLERLALDADGVSKLLSDVVGSDHVSEATVLATCNRTEVYAEVDRFHGSVEDVSRLMVERAGESRDDFTPHLYVHYDAGAVAHVFSVAAGLDSMVVGESQILGQVRDALRRGQDAGSVSASLNPLFQQALRVGKRAHAETDIDRAGPSLVSVAVDRVEPVVDGLRGRRALIIGAGSMAALAVTTLTRRGVGTIVIANRSAERAERLARSAGGRTVSLEDLADEVRRADLVVSCTGATSLVLTSADVDEALDGRGARPLAIIDLALPHDVDTVVEQIPGVTLVGLADLAETVTDQVTAADIEQVRRIVAEEVATFESARRAARVTPTVVALRSMATGVVEAELERLDGRLPGLDPMVRAELEHTVRRVAHKLLHAPTVRIKELAEQPAGSSYADALAELFALHPGAVAAVTHPGVAAASMSELTSQDNPGPGQLIADTTGRPRGESA
jgi:glutamyl-tRNA reductase